MGSVGDAFDNAVIESFWGRMQTELLNGRRWTTRTELANAIFDYLKIAVQRELGVPVKLIGLGEGPDDLAPFDPQTFPDARLP